MFEAQVQSGAVSQSDSIAAEVVSAILNAGSPGKSPAPRNIALVNRLETERRSARASGTIVFSDQYAPLWCELLDICDIGARLKVASVNQVPGLFKLTIEQIGLATDCKVVWRTDSDIGVVFQSAQR